MNPVRSLDSKIDGNHRGLAYWRERILQAILGVGLSIALVTFIPMTIMAVKERLWVIPVLNTAVYALALIIFVFRQIRYELRAVATLFLAYILGAYLTWHFGFLSGGPVCLFAFAVLAGLLLGRRAAVAALIVNALTLLIFGWLAATGRWAQNLPLFPTMMRSIVALATYILMNAAAAVSAAVLVRGMHDLAGKEHAANEELRNERRKLFKEMEERIKIEAALRESEEKFSLAFRISPAAMGITRANNGRFVEVNDAFVSVTGYAREEAISSTSIGLRLWVDEENRKSVINNLSNGRKVVGREVRLRKKDGAIIPVLFAADVIMLRNERFFLSSVYDMTDHIQARAYEEERKRAEALAELDHAKTTFFSNVSHEFRTPLTLMLGPVEEMLSSPGGLREAEREQLQLVYRNGLRLLKLVNTLLDFAGIEAGRIEAVYAPTDLAGLTSDLASVFRSAVEGAGLKYKVHCDPLAEPVYVDPEMWEKIVLNLLSNAFKHTFQGEIEVRLEKRGGHAVLSVRDTGTGIPKSEMPHLFKRFHRVLGAGSRTHEGSGIGLSLVQELVRLHGGRIEVQSTEGEGSAFSVRMPLGRDHLPSDRVGMERTLAASPLHARAFVEEALGWVSDDTGSSEPRADPAGEPIKTPGHFEPFAKALKGARILLADDNVDMRRYIRRLLALYGSEVIAVADGNAALDAIRSKRPDLVLADVMMPGLDGFGLLRAIRSDKEINTLPVLMLSARAGEESKIEGLGAGADDYLVKPFRAGELLAHVGAHIKIARIRKHTEQALRESRDELEKRVLERTAELSRRAEQLARLSSELTLAEQRERRRLAAVIHDHLQQLLVALKIRLEVLAGDLGKVHQQDFEQIYNLLVEALKTTRSLNVQLSPAVLYERGLAAGLEWLARTMQETYQIAVATDLDPLAAPEREAVKVLLFESVRELLFNMVKHAQTKSGRLAMAPDGPDSLRITVSDEGVGFDPDKLAKQLGRDDRFGLFSIRERLELIGGSLKIESVPGSGSTFTLIAPCGKKGLNRNSERIPRSLLRG